MIVFTCNNCNHVTLIGTLKKTLNEVHCKCEAVYRIQITVLHDGKPVDHAQREAALAYTYDTEGNRIALSDMRRQAAAVRYSDTDTPDGRSQSGDRK